MRVDELTKSSAPSHDLTHPRAYCDTYHALFGVLDWAGHLIFKFNVLSFDQSASIRQTIDQASQIQRPLTYFVRPRAYCDTHHALFGILNWAGHHIFNSTY